jgi:hypothetical protein
VLSAALAGATLVTPAAYAAAPTPITGAVLEWTGSAELQATQPASPEAGAPACSYFSAGISAPYVAGSGQSSYRAVSGNVSVRKGSSAATWATRCAGATSAGAVHQRVVVTGGTGTVDRSSGATTIQWTGSWSVNFYGGMIPFSITNPKLVVGANGSGTITATLAGYKGQIGSADVEPIAPVPGVVIADLRGVGSGNPTGFVVTPRYGDVTYNAPGGVAPQNRTTAGWGAWPKSFVDFHVKTGLSSYWYSSGGAADEKKPPTPVVVKYGAGKAAATATLTPAKKKLTLGKALKVKVKVRAAGGVVATGKVKVMDRKKKVATASLSHGKAVVKLKNLTRGKHKLWASYAGSALVGADSSPKVTVKVKKR